MFKKLRNWIQLLTCINIKQAIRFKIKSQNINNEGRILDYRVAYIACQFCGGNYNI